VCCVKTALNHQQVNIEVPKIMEPGPHKISATQPRSHDHRLPQAYLLDTPGKKEEKTEEKSTK
jgi:hypothetical protein